MTVKDGRAEDYYFEPSAKYDVTLFYVDGTEVASTLEVLINDRGIGKIESGTSNFNLEHNIEGMAGS